MRGSWASLGRAARDEATYHTVTFQPEDLLRPEDLTRLFPDRHTLAFDRRVLIASYTEHCRRQCSSDRVIAINVGRAEKLLDTLDDLGAISREAIEAWQNIRLGTVARKTVNLEQDVLRQLLDLCVRHRWRLDTPA